MSLELKRTEGAPTPVHQAGPWTPACLITSLQSVLLKVYEGKGSVFPDFLLCLWLQFPVHTPGKDGLMGWFVLDFKSELNTQVFASYAHKPRSFLWIMKEPKKSSFPFIGLTIYSTKSVKR
jgi:hypothetical protein